MKPIIVLALIASGCVTNERVAPSFATGFDTPETDGILIEWQQCTVNSPCIDGDADGVAYSLGFQDSPGFVAGHVGNEKIRLILDANSVYRLGDHAIEMMYIDEERKTVLALTWNELDQIPVDSRLVIAN